MIRKMKQMSNEGQSLLWPEGGGGGGGGGKKAALALVLIVGLSIGVVYYFYGNPLTALSTMMANINPPPAPSPNSQQSLSSLSLTCWNSGTNYGSPTPSSLAVATSNPVSANVRCAGVMTGSSGTPFLQSTTITLTSKPTSGLSQTPQTQTVISDGTGSFNGIIVLPLGQTYAITASTLLPNSQSSISSPTATVST